MNELSTELKKDKPYTLTLKDGEIVKLTFEKGEAIRKWRDNKAVQGTVSLHRDNGMFWRYVEKNDIKGLYLREAANTGAEVGYNCAWGIWHETYPSYRECSCWKDTKIDPWTMKDVRKQLFPDWKYGNAMTPSMRNACYAHATKLLTK